MNTLQPADEQLDAGGTAGFVAWHDLAHVHGICAACGVTNESLLMVRIVPSPAGLDRTKVQLSLKIFLSHRGQRPGVEEMLVEETSAKAVASSGVAHRRPMNRLPPPASVNFSRLAWVNTVAVVGYHLIALLAVLPWFFSWTGVLLTVAGCYVFGTLGINLCYHRLLAHRGLTCPKWLEHTLALLGVCCLQDTPASWVAIHRRHHQYSDERSDPHSPLVGFFWAHMGWLLVENEDLKRLGIYQRYAKDVLLDRFYKGLERNARWVQVIFLSWLVFFLGGLISELLRGGTLVQAIQFASSVLVWGVFVRTVLVWHITWSVNSVTHLWGYRRYATDEESRNNVFVGILGNGEGWHNNHHADSRSAKHGHRWWELDVTYLTIRLLGTVGLARDILTPNPHLATMQGRGRLMTRERPAIPTD